MSVVNPYQFKPWTAVGVALTLGANHAWALDESSGTNARDQGTDSVDGTYTNLSDVTLDIVGPAMAGGPDTGGVHLVGSGSGAGCVLLPSPVGNLFTGDHTLSFWLKPTEAGSGYSVFSCVTADGWSQPVQMELITGNYIRIRYGSGVGSETTVKTGTIPLNVNEWNHVAIAVSGTDLGLYVAGVLDGAASLVGVSRVFSSRPSYIGSRNASVGQGATTGDYAAFSIFDRALTPTEIRTLALLRSVSVGDTIPVDTDGKYNAWPSITKSRQTSRLHCSYSKGNSHYQDHSNYAVYKNSDDNGATWSNLTQISPSPGGNLRYLGGGVVALANGRIVYGYCLVNWSTGAGQLFVKYSDDDGDSWSAAVGPLPGWTNNDNVCGGTSLFQSSTGRLFFTMYGTNSGDTSSNFRCGVCYSDDNGETWSGPVAVGPGNNSGRYNESCITQRLDGTLVCFVRSEASASVPMYEATSTDDGLTWSSLTTVNSSLTGTAFNTQPGNPAAAVATAHAGLMLLVYRRYTGAQYQFWPAYRLSTDGGVTFDNTEQFLVDDVTYEYAGVCMLDRNTFGVIYAGDNPPGQDEQNPGIADIYFKRLEIIGP